MQGYSSLVRIPEKTFAQENADGTYRLEPYDQTIHYSARRGKRPDVTRTLGILHRNNFFHPADARVVHWLNEVQQHLEYLGTNRSH